MTNTLENKAKFFAQYWGQKVFKAGNSQSIPHKNTFGRNIKAKDFLELTPLSQISDDDFNTLHQTNGYIIEDIILNIGGNSVTVYFKWIDKEFTDGFGHSASTIYFDGLNGFGVDFLRSRGYAIPFMGVSVETLIDWGWVKFKGGDND